MLSPSYDLTFYDFDKDDRLVAACTIGAIGNRMQGMTAQIPSDPIHRGAENWFAPRGWGALVDLDVIHQEFHARDACRAIFGYDIHRNFGVLNDTRVVFREQKAYARNIRRRDYSRRHFGKRTGRQTEQAEQDEAKSCQIELNAHRRHYLCLTVCEQGLTPATARFSGCALLRVFACQYQIVRVFERQHAAQLEQLVAQSRRFFELKIQ